MNEVHPIVPPSVSHALTHRSEALDLAVHAFRRTWAEAAAEIDALCPDGDEPSSGGSPERFAKLDRTLRYLDGLGWMLLDRRRRRLIADLRRSLRALEKVSPPTGTKAPVLERTVCRDRFRAASAAIRSIPMLITPYAVSAYIAEYGPAFMTEARTREAIASARFGERAFAGYRIRAALRRGRIRSALALAGEWLALLLRGESR
jgi:hypothetical protein